MIIIETVLKKKERNIWNSSTQRHIIIWAGILYSKEGI